MTIRGRRRASAAVGYLNPVKSRRNLVIETRALTHRVLLQGKRASGIEYSQNGALHQATPRKEVLLCGGAINSPQILQLSGIGPGGHLQSLGIEVKHDLPGVGENLQDHIGGRIIHRCVDGTVTMNEIYHNWLRRLYAGAEWILAQKGPLMTGAGPMGLFVKTRPELDSPDVQYQFLAGSAEKTGDPMHRFPGCTMVAIPCRPESRGWLRIKTPDPTEAPAKQPNYLSTQRDRDTIVAGLRVTRRIFATAAMQRYCKEEIYPGPKAQTDDDLLNHVRATDRHHFSPDQHLHDGTGPQIGGRYRPEGEGSGRLAGDRCLDYADRGVRQHQRHGHHDCRKRSGYDPASGMSVASPMSFAGRSPWSPGRARTSAAPLRSTWPPPARPWWSTAAVTGVRWTVSWPRSTPRAARPSAASPTCPTRSRPRR